MSDRKEQMTQRVRDVKYEALDRALDRAIQNLQDAHTYYNSLTPNGTRTHTINFDEIIKYILQAQTAMTNEHLRELY